MVKKREHRSARVASVSDDGRTIEVRAVTYGVVDDFGSVFLPGTFSESLERRLPTFAWGHDWSEPIGRATAWNDSDEGLDLTMRLSDPDAVPRARQAMVQFADGTIDDVSVGFSGTSRRSPTKDEEKQWFGVREVITSADLDETSAVLRGAVPGAKVLSVRSSAEVDLDAVVALAKRVAAGELTAEEAKVAVDLLGGDPEGDGEDPPVVSPVEPEPPDELDAELDAQLDAALDAALGRSARR